VLAAVDADREARTVERGGVRVNAFKARIAALYGAVLTLWVMPALALAQQGGQPGGSPTGGGAGTTGGSGWLWIIAALVILAIIWWAVSSRRRGGTGAAR
jgi:hypothetical protein